MRPLWFCTLPFCALLLAISPLPKAAADDGLAGRWRLHLERSGWQPALCEGVLQLSNDGERLAGGLRFQTILFAREHPLVDVAAQKDELHFSLQGDDFVLEFTGRRDGDRLQGTCAWKGLGEFPWTAERDTGEPPPRFDPQVRAGRDWPRGEAEKLGLDGAALDALLLDASRASSDALLIVKGGKVVCEQYFGRPIGRIHLMSVTKAFTALAAAYLLESGALDSLDQPVSDFYPEWSEGTKSEVTLRHLLTHTSGLEARPNAMVLNQQTDKVAHVLAMNVEAEPGTRFRYSNEAVALLGGILAEAAGESVDESMKEKLFDPLHLEDVAWDRDGSGHTITYAQLAMTARDLAKVGRTLADGGRWKGRTVFPKEWIPTLTTPATEASPACGLLWWLYRNDRGEVVGYGHDGWLGQYLVVVPEHELVAVRLRRFVSDADAAVAANDMTGFPGRVLGLLRKR